MHNVDDKAPEYPRPKPFYGVYYHIVNDRRFTYRIAWLILIVMAISICIWQISDRVQAYFEFPTTRKYEIIHEQNMIFPAITICDTLRYQENIVPEEDKEFIRKLSTSFYHIDNTSSIEQHYLDYQHKLKLLYKHNYSFPDIILRNAYLLNDKTLKKCHFDQEDCSRQNFRFYFSSDFEPCWTFNSDLSTKLYVQEVEGVKNGLFLIVDLKIKEYKATPLNNAYQDILEGTFKLFVHANHELPMYFLKAKTISPGYITKARILYEKDIHMKPPHGQCTSEKLHNFKNYTFSNCFMDCILKYRSTCNCQPIFHFDNLKANSRLCDFYDIFLCETLRLKYTGSSSNTEDKFETQPEPGCSCEISCIEDTYDVTLSYSQVLENEFIKNLASENNVTMEYIRSNYLFLIIYYDNFIYTKSTQIPTMSISSLISDIGGQLGLFLGVSLLTLAEFLDYIVNKTERKLPTSNNMI